MTWLETVMTAVLAGLSTIVSLTINCSVCKHQRRRRWTLGSPTDGLLSVALLPGAAQQTTTGTTIVAVRVGQRAAVQLHQIAFMNRLVRSGVRDRRDVDGRDVDFVCGRLVCSIADRSGAPGSGLPE